MKHTTATVTLLDQFTRYHINFPEYGVPDTETVVIGGNSLFLRVSTGLETRLSDNVGPRVQFFLCIPH